MWGQGQGQGFQGNQGFQGQGFQGQNWGNNMNNTPYGQGGMGMQPNMGGMGMQGGMGGMGMQGGMGGMGMLGGMNMGGMNMGGNKAQWQQNPFYNQNQRWGQGGYNQMPQWQNQHNVYVPPIQFNGGCRKCNGTGMISRKATQMPCRRCYKKQGICPKCFGGGINYFNGKPCRKCQGGRWQKRKGRRSSSSSSSDSGWGCKKGFNQGYGNQGYGNQGFNQGYGNQGFQGGYGGQW